MWISPYNPNVKPLKACKTCKTLSLWQTSSAVCISSQSCQGPQSDEMMQRSTSFKWKQVLVWPVLESQTALPWNWGWRPCLRNTLQGREDIACPNFQSCHNWLVHLVSPACRSQSRNVKPFLVKFWVKVRYHLFFASWLDGWVTIVIKKSLKSLPPLFCQNLFLQQFLQLNPPYYHTIVHQV